MEYIVYDAGEISLCQFFYFKALRKLTGQLVASHLAGKLLTLSLCVSIFSGTSAVAYDLIARTFLNRMCLYNSILCVFFSLLDLLELSARTKNHPSMSAVFHNLFVFWLIFCKICYRILSPFLFQHVLSNFFCIVV